MQAGRPSPAPEKWTGERFRGAPPKVVALLLGVELLAVVLCVITLAFVRVRTAQWVDLALLCGLCVAFEEISHQVGKLRLMVRTGPLADMTSVWTFAGAFLFPAGLAGPFAIFVLSVFWLRQTRGTGQLLYRHLYTAATIVLASLAASVVIHNESRLTGLPHMLPDLVGVVVAAGIYTLVNRALIILAMVVTERPVAQSLFGRWSDNALELATLCLGVMTAVVLAEKPTWIPVVLLPMALLQRGALVAELEEAASTDVKTKLLNALAWQQVAERELTALRHEGAAGAVLIIDLDHFKTVNDRLGHLVGDAALVCVGENLKRVLRQHDVVGRFGGEEFVALLPRIDVRTALLIAERVRACIRAVSQAEFCPLDTDGDVPAMQLSASIGVATFPDHGNEIDELLRAADTALYVAKRTGRDRVALAGDGPERRVSSPR
jgi:diguanylate cyclase (GGDEF)-like protein